ncbi:hypothetical protein CEXT_22911 [Caerostris extrusa]|uniref:Uncharacterized protein n=1 Tax=Caerostris extrusa TaxID=172846 RepID=A0AAV4VBC3_CAEEX|nr:hypothetical protein CEXT_22911 [Caerostris extrusa]
MRTFRFGTKPRLYVNPLTLAVYEFDTTSFFFALPEARKENEVGITNVSGCSGITYVPTSDQRLGKILASGSKDMGKWLSSTSGII